MGLTGERIRSVFSKSRSVSAHDDDVKNFGAYRRRWNLMRSHVSVNEVNSVLAEEDSASITSSEATVTWPLKEEETGDIQSGAGEEQILNGKDDEERCCAAKVIQSAFRGFLARRRCKEIQKFSMKYRKEETNIPFVESEGTPIEVHTGASTVQCRAQEKSATLHHRAHRKSKTQTSKVKERWDDSPVSTNVAKLRIQNRLEATTRREKALAYAFSQQLRTCARMKKQSLPDCTESNFGWSWLERWMATRLPEPSVKEQPSKYLRPVRSHQTSVDSKKKLDVGEDEKESSGSNEVSDGLDSIAAKSKNNKDGRKPVGNRHKAVTTASSRKTVPSCQQTAQQIKVGEKETKEKKVQRQSMGEMKCREIHPLPKGSLILV